MTAVRGRWNDNREVFVADDGREFWIFSEHVREEPRFYWAEEKIPGDEQRFKEVPFDGVYSRVATLRARIERHVRTTTA